MKIVDMKSLSETQVIQAAQMLADEIPGDWEDWSEVVNTDEVLEDEDTFFKGFAAVEDGDIIGWVGVDPGDSDYVYELFPLVVRRDMRGKGIGKMLLAVAEAHVRENGGLTAITYIDIREDKSFNESFLASVDLYDNLPKHIINFSPAEHTLSHFLLKNGYKAAGVIPDSGGHGKPDIILAKHI